jgi:hypothetical protein
MRDPIDRWLTPDEQPDAVIEPSGNASAAATPSRSGVSGDIASRGGNDVVVFPLDMVKKMRCFFRQGASRWIRKKEY